jgi:hypothetical protein
MYTADFTPSHCLASDPPCMQTRESEVTRAESKGPRFIGSQGVRIPGQCCLDLAQRRFNLKVGIKCICCDHPQDVVLPVYDTMIILVYCRKHTVDLSLVRVTRLGIHTVSGK